MDAAFIHPDLYNLYIGELLSNDAEYYMKKVEGKYGDHFHAQCSCKGCSMWCPHEDRVYSMWRGETVAANYDEDAKNGYELCITDRTPMTLNTVIIPGVDEVVTVVKTRPWQSSCECEHCEKLWAASVHYLKLQGSEFTLDDIDNIRKHFHSVTRPSILPLASPSNKAMKMFWLIGGNHMEVEVHIHRRTLYIDIITSSEDGSHIDRDPDHRKPVCGWGKLTSDGTFVAASP